MWTVVTKRRTFVGAAAYTGVLPTLLTRAAASVAAEPAPKAATKAVTKTANEAVVHDAAPESSAGVKVEPAKDDLLAPLHIPVCCQLCDAAAASFAPSSLP